MKKGFTLIELLAVILILGIIALIAIPTVTSVIEDSKKGSLKTSASNVLRAAEENCQLEKIKGSSITKLYTIENGIISGNLNIKNASDSGTIAVDYDCNASIALVDNGYCVVKKNEVTTINNDIYNCNIDYVNIPKTEDTCFIFDEASKTITGYKFDNVSCPSDISIPATINGVPVEHIGDYAFKSVSSDYIQYHGRLLSGTDNIDYVLANFDYFDEISFIYITYGKKAVTTPQKRCYYDSGTVQVKPIDYPIKAIDNILACNLLGTGDTLNTNVTTVTTKGKITGVDFKNATNLKSIGNGAFLQNDIKNLYFKDNDNLTEIGYSAFGNNSLTGVLNLTGLKNLTTIKEGVFANNQISSVIFPDTLTTISKAMFINNSIEEVTMPNSVTTLSTAAFENNLITKVNYSENLDSIGDFAFKNDHITGTTIFPDKVKKIGFWSYGLNADLTAITLGRDMETIEYEAFSNDGVKSITFNSKLKKIGDYSFYNCGISNLTTPSSLETIVIQAFYNNGMNYLILNEGLKEIKYQAFIYNYIKMNDTTKFKLPSTLENLGSGCFNRNNVSDSNYMFFTKIENGVKDTTTLISVAASGMEQEIIVPDTIKKVDGYAFYNDVLKKVTFSNNLEKISAVAFYNYSSNKGTIVLGTGIKTIESEAFHCENNWHCAYTLEIPKTAAEFPKPSSQWGNTFMTVSYTK